MCSGSFTTKNAGKIKVLQSLTHSHMVGKHSSHFYKGQTFQSVDLPQLLQNLVEQESDHNAPSFIEVTAVFVLKNSAT